MKQLSLSLLFVIGCISLISAMENDPNNNNTIIFLSPKQIIEQPDVFLNQDEHPETYTWIKNHEDTLGVPSANHPCNNNVSWREHLLSTQEKMGACGESMSTQNYIFNTGYNTFVRVAGPINILHSRVSNAGIDPGPQANMYVFDENGNGYKDEILQQATNNTEPVFQHTSMIAYYLIMKKQLESTKIQPVKTMLARRNTTWKEGSDQEIAGRPLNDHNYVIVQPKNPESYHRLDTLGEVEFNAVVSKDRLTDLAKAVNNGAWCLNRENVLYDTATDNYYITDLEKPNNEGWGPNAKWKTAVLSEKGDGTSSDQWKWEHNIRCGYESVETGLLEHAVNKQELVQEWDALQEQRAPKE